MRELNSYIQSGDVSRAVAVALSTNPVQVFEQIDYHAMSDDAELYANFAREFYAASDELNRVQVAAWIADHSVAELAYLEMESEAAHLLSSSVAAAIVHIAGMLNDGMDTVAYGPDAGITNDQLNTYREIATALRGLAVPIATAKNTVD